MMLAGVRVSNADVLDLARTLSDAGFDDTADVLTVAWEAGQALVALTIADRNCILRVLEEPPVGLAELRAVLLQEQERR
jgi:hypothetical protein